MAYEEQTHQEKRHAEELRAAAEDLLGRLEQEKLTMSSFGPLSLQDLERTDESEVTVDEGLPAPAARRRRRPA